MDPEVSARDEEDDAPSDAIRGEVRLAGHNESVTGSFCPFDPVAARTMSSVGS
jgi:hypothetical protein